MTYQTREILKQYWGYDSFRPLQEDIINSVLQGRDTLALLPTGGGKSICFQVPGLARDGVTLVISPLIALMADQVYNLKQRGISAIALNSAMSPREIDNALENCVNGRYKFLYVSPERLQTELFTERLKRMQVALIAVDEAHCISQWGYDFRPSYLEIASIRPLIPDAPVIALTATATPTVTKDIQRKLEFAENNVYQSSFKRENLFYNVLQTENKWNRCLEIFRKVAGSGILYTRSRKGTVKIARLLQEHGISSDFYHAGLSAEERSRKQNEWINNQTRIMVSTNAFGMGIDKPDVRLVLHLELPESLEAYFQEAGRAGRDGKTAHAVMIVSPNDEDELRQKTVANFPDKGFIQTIYKALGNYFHLAEGSGQEQTFAFDATHFFYQYNFPAAKAYEALRILQKEGILTFDENSTLPSRLKLKADRTTLYDYQLRNEQADKVIKVLLRSYGGLDVEYSKIHEPQIASRTQLPEKRVRNILEELNRRELVDYIPKQKGGYLCFLQERVKPEYLQISRENLKLRLQAMEKRIASVIHYAGQQKECRSRELLRYFGEEHSTECGGCDVCRKKKKQTLTDADFQKWKARIRESLAQNPVTPDQLAARHNNKENFRKTLQILIDEELIHIDRGILYWKGNE